MRYRCALDAALFRRFDDLIEFTLPSGELVVRTLKQRLVNVRLERGISWTQVGSMMFSQAYIVVLFVLFVQFFVETYLAPKKRSAAAAKKTN